MFKFIPIFIAIFFLSFHSGTIIYVNSSLLNNFFKSDIVSLLFFAGALGNALLFLFIPKLIRQIGKNVLLFVFIILTVASTLGLAFFDKAFWVLISFVVYSSFLLMIYYCFDIFLEEISEDKNTGRIRGLYFTIINTGIALGPLLLTTLTEDDNLKIIYIAAALLLIPPFILTLFSFKSHSPKEHRPYHPHAFLPYKTWWKTKNIRHVTLARFVLEFFFVFMIIYIPIYLHNIIGFEWSELGIIITIALLPFIFLEWPAGRLADKLWGEKEIMSAGFLITGVSLLFMPFIGKVFIIWMIILFASRVGASLVEVMTESYFFKHVNSDDTGLISIFRLTRPVSIIFGSMVGVLVLNLFSFEKIFFILVIVILFGLRESLHLKDTL